MNLKKYGLIKKGNRISADNGASFLEKNMSINEFKDLLFDIEIWMEKELAADEIWLLLENLN